MAYHTGEASRSFLRRGCGPGSLTRRSVSRWDSSHVQAVPDLQHFALRRLQTTFQLSDISFVFTRLAPTPRHARERVLRLARRSSVPTSSDAFFQKAHEPQKTSSQEPFAKSGTGTSKKSFRMARIAIYDSNTCV